MLSRLRTRCERLLEWIVIALMIIMTVEVILGVTFRKLEMSLSWYDEIAEVTLAWLTYYGSALAALKGAHIGFPGLIDALRPAWRVPLVIIGELFVFTFFIALTWTGVQVLDVLATDTLVSLPEIPVSYTQSVIPIGGALFLIAEALRLPELLRQAAAPGHPVEPIPED